MQQTSLSDRPKVVVLHALRPTSRQTTVNHVLCFREHLPNCDVQFLHFQQPLSRELFNTPIDLLLVNYDFLNYRFTPLWPFVKDRHLRLAQSARRVVAIAQDDFWASRLLDGWCVRWNIDRILTSAESGIETLYPRSSRRTEIRRVLNGYSPPVAPSTRAPIAEREIDLGQRVREMSPHLGRFAQEKARQASVLEAAAKSAGFRVDVSTRNEDAFIGQSWYEFLSRCRFTVGMKGGASISDPYGLLHSRVNRYRSRFPTSSYEEVERACLRRADQSQVFAAVSPRIFDAASTGTCQILREDNYLGILEPWTDFIPLCQDFSNISKVLDAMKDLQAAQEIADSCYAKLIASGRFSYSHLVASATEELLEGSSLTSRVGSEKWLTLCKVIEDQTKVQREHGVELHDAVQVAMLSRYLKRGTREARTYLGKILNDLGLEEWYRRQVELSLADGMIRRAVWTWRAPS